MSGLRELPLVRPLGNVGDRIARVVQDFTAPFRCVEGGPQDAEPEIRRLARHARRQLGVAPAFDLGHVDRRDPLSRGTSPSNMAI